MATFPIGYDGATGDAAQLSSMSGWMNLDAVFRSRLLAMFAASGGRVGFGEGWRSADTQAAGARDKPGVMAPQGKSWHEVGMAADIVGDMDWLQQNAARYGLKTFADVNNEPWHVQPIEVPNARALNAPPPKLSDSPQNSPQGLDAGMTNSAQAGSPGPVDIPPDMTMIAVRGPDGVERLYAIHQISPGIHISYSVPFDGSARFDGSRVQFLTQAQANQRYGRGIMAGDAVELAAVTSTFGSFGGMWNSILGQVMGNNNPARHDPGVLAVIAEFAGRPDMDPVELQNKLQATKWYQDRTADQLEWNSLSQAERRKRLDETAARMAATIFQYFGDDVDANDPRVKNSLQAVASGQIGFGAWTRTMQTQAADIAESPWARQLRDEKEQQRQRPIDIENTSQRVREATERWGLQWSAETIQRWARDMVEKKMSDEDLIKELRKQAQILYPWKDPEVETATAAAPWLETYRRVMEKSATINSADVKRALVSGQSVVDFETQLKKSDAWLATRNGQDELHTMAAELGSRMGFA